MSANDQKESIVNELSNISQELDNIASELASDFENVGNNQCSECLYDIAYNLRQTINSIRYVDLSSVG